MHNFFNSISNQPLPSQETKTLSQSAGRSKAVLGNAAAEELICLRLLSAAAAELEEDTALRFALIYNTVLVLDFLYTTQATTCAS